MADRLKEFKDFYIAIGQPGAYSKSMDYTILDEYGKRVPNVIALNDQYNIKIKHAPYSVMPKVKNVVVQSWKDEDGDDVWLPRRTGSAPGTYIPAITHEAVEFNPTFVIYNKSYKDKEDGEVKIKNDANAAIRDLLNRIEGRWLRIFDSYTGIGYDGVYLIDVDDDPKFKRRNYEYVEFSLKFRINGPNIDNIWEGLINE